LLAQTTQPAAQTPQWSPDRVLATWDKNADGRLTADEVPRPALFKALARSALSATTNRAHPALPWVTEAVSAPRLQHCTFASAAAGTNVSYHLYTPPAYDAEPERRFPVVYWLHGSGGGLPGTPSLVAHFNDAIRAGRTPPMLVVFVNGLPHGMYCDWQDGSAPVETVIIRELLPHVDASFRTVAAREWRMLEGFSMGGYGAARLGFKYPELFGAVSILGGGPLQPDFTEAPRAGPRNRDRILQSVFGGDLACFRGQSPWHIAETNAAALRSGLRIRQIIGDRDETLAMNRDFHAHLERLGIPHDYREVPGVGHQPNALLRALGDDDWAFYRTAALPSDDRVGPGFAHAARWKDTGVAPSAPLPPAENFKPRPHSDEAAKAGLKPDVLAKLDVEMQRHVAASNVAGIVALVHKNGVRGYFEAFGWQDIEARKPMPKDGIFRLMSMTKPVIAVAALTLLDEGKFTLDEPISKHLPEWAEPKVLEGGQLVPAKSAITPRMLMSHSSGLYYGSLGTDAADEGGAAALAFSASRGQRTSLKEFSETLAKQPLKFHPGTSYQYGHSIDILGRYLEAVTGKPLDEVLKEKVFVPLKMVDTDFWVPPAKASRLCQIYTQPRPGVLRPGRESSKLTEKPSLFLGGHGLCSTTADYERFCRMMLNRGELDGVRVLKPETVDLMFQNHLKPELGQKYGLGGAVDGEGGYWWGGANGTQFWIDRENNLFALFMVQTQHYRAPTYNAFRALVNEAAGITSRRSGLTGPRTAGANRAFQQRDTNGDGKLSRDELPGALFDRLDANKDGFVTDDEASTLWRNKQPGPQL
jgi:CubicO group peptidase (beta-lactamase class C family)/enterochelin esterase-like enzyme